MTFSEVELQPDPEQNLRPDPPVRASAPAEMFSRRCRSPLEAPSQPAGTSNNPPSQKVFPVFSLHSVELYRQPPLAQAPSLWSKPERQKQHLLLKSMSKDSSFSSFESLPELLGGRSRSSQRSESESGIVSDTGDTETSSRSSNSEGQEKLEGSPPGDTSKQRRARTEEKMEKAWRRDERRRQRRGGGAAVQLLVNGRETTERCSEEQPSRASSPLASQASSLESILVLDEELFPSKDLLPRCSSLESCLLPAHTSDGEPGEEPGQQSRTGGAGRGPSSEELSRRTLDLLKRLENIQTPPATTMTRSISDMTLQSSSTQRSRLPASASLGGSLLGRVPGSSQEEPAVQRSSATASLTELSSAEDSSLGSDHAAVLRRQHLMMPNADGNSNFPSDRKRCHGNRRGGVDEADASSVSLLVNVSCTCTDEDEDDSDLLSSSTLTLTEEELGFQQEEVEGLSSTSSENEEEEEEMDGSYVLGVDYLTAELQNFIRSPRAFSSQPDSSLLDELQCGASLSSSTSCTSSTQGSEQQSFLRGAADRVPETNNLEKTQPEEQKKRSYISRLVDDVENGNVEQSRSKSKEEDDKLLREESSVFTKRGAAREESYVFPRSAQFPADVPSCASKAESRRQELRPSTHKRSSSLVGQLKGELPCHSSSRPPPPALSPVEDRSSHDALQTSSSPAAGRKAITIQEKFKFSSVVMEETRREVRDVEAAPPPRERQGCPPSCHGHLPSSSPLQKENVHHFVMEIIDMTSTVLRSKGQPEEAGQDSRSAQEQGPPLAQIRDKVASPPVAMTTLPPSLSRAVCLLLLRSWNTPTALCSCARETSTPTCLSPPTTATVGSPRPARTPSAAPDVSPPPPPSTPRPRL